MRHNSSNLEIRLRALKGHTYFGVKWQILPLCLMGNFTPIMPLCIKGKFYAKAVVMYITQGRSHEILSGPVQ